MKLTAQFIAGAYNNLSFDPDKRGIRELESFEAWKVSTKETIISKIGFENDLILADINRLIDIIEAYKIKYYSQLSRCASSAITGGSNFPVARNQKNRSYSDNTYQKMLDTEKKITAKIYKKYIPSDIIKNGDSDSVEKLKAKIKAQEARRELMKQANKIVRTKADNETKTLELKKLGFSEDLAYELLNPRFHYAKGYQTFELSNLGALIRTNKQRLAFLERQKSKVDSEEVKETCIVKVCYADNRVRVFHESKPDKTVIQSLKSNGFRWTPSLTCWQAYINDRSLRFIKELD